MQLTKMQVLLKVYNEPETYLKDFKKLKFKRATSDDLSELFSFDNNGPEDPEDVEFYGESAYERRCYNMTKKIIRMYPAFGEYVNRMFYVSRMALADHVFWKTQESSLYDKYMSHIFA